jgi:regulator of protease activity HflC (stomatin/prohibitin superfamily)
MLSGYNQHRKKENTMTINTVIQFLSGIAWMAFLGLVVLAVTRASRGQGVKGLSTGVIAMLVVAVLLSTVGAGLVFLQADQYGVVVSAFSPKGYRENAIGPGLHWIIPFAESVRTYSVAKQTYTMSSTPNEGQVVGDDSVQARTKDGQQVYIDASVTYSIDPAKVVNLNITWQNRYQDELVRTQSRGIIRDAASQYGVEEIVSTKRAELEKQITDALFKRFSENDLKLENFIVRNIRFSDEYAKAVEQKQIAEQQAQQAKFVVEQKKQEAEQARQTAQGQADAAVIASKGAADARIIQAEAEAKALQLIANVLANNPSLLQYQYITKLSPNVQIMLVPSNAPFILPQLQLTPTTPQ